MNEFIRRVFASQQARSGGVVRRSKYWIDFFASEAELLAEVKNRNFHAVEVGNQIIVICGEGDIKVLC